MRRLLQFLAIAVLTVSCSPLGYVMTLDVRQPSQAGLEAGGKTMSIVYLESENGADSVFNNKVADALAIALEEDYFDGEQAIDIFRAVKDPKGVYASKDTLSHYVMTLDADVVMLLDTPAVNEKADGSKMQRSSLYVYDSQGDDDVILLNCDIKAQERLTASSAIVVGQNLAGPLKSEWKTEMYTLVYYDGFVDNKWIDAIEAAEQMKWDDAISIWLDLVKSNDVYASSSAMYNIAMGCYMLREYELADEWIKRSDDTHVLSLSDGMHKRIDAALGKQK